MLRTATYCRLFYIKTTRTTSITYIYLQLFIFDVRLIREEKENPIDHKTPRCKCRSSFSGLSLSFAPLTGLRAELYWFFIIQHKWPMNRNVRFYFILWKSFLIFHKFYLIESFFAWIIYMCPLLQCLCVLFLSLLKKIIILRTDTIESFEIRAEAKHKKWIHEDVTLISLLYRFWVCIFYVEYCFGEPISMLRSCLSTNSRYFLWFTSAKAIMYRRFNFQRLNYLKKMKIVGQADSSHTEIKMNENTRDLKRFTVYLNSIGSFLLCLSIIQFDCL